MAAVINTRDVLLQAASPRLLSTSLPSTVTVLGNVTGQVAGAAAATVVSNAAAGYNIQQALEVSGSTVLKGVLVPTDAGAMKTGTITWNSTTGALTGGTGTAMTTWGLLCASAGVAKFSLEASTGDSIFAGELRAATGTFSGSLSAATVQITDAAGTNKMYLTNGATEAKILATGTGRLLILESDKRSGSTSTVNPGIRIDTTNAGNHITYNNTNGTDATCYLETPNKDLSVSAGTATLALLGGAITIAGNIAQTSGTSQLRTLNVSTGGMSVTGTSSLAEITTSSTALVSNLYAENAKSLKGQIGNYLTFQRGTVTGSATATFNSTNKPGSNTSNVWIEIKIDTTTLYIPVWQ